MPDASVRKTMMIALGVCLVCSILVSSTAVSLKAVQEENKRLDRIANILAAGDLIVNDQEILNIYETMVQPELLELETGQILPHDGMNELFDIEDFDIKSMADSAEYGRAVSTRDDIAKISRIPRYMVVYLIRDNNRTEKIILPVYGQGLWSAMYGFIALDRDLKTIKGITFYEHAETPGLGGEIDTPKWKNSWKGKQAFDENGKLKISVIKGAVDRTGPDARFQIDGITGATLTSRGVDNTVKFWLGKNGYGPFLNRLLEDVDG